MRNAIKRIICFTLSLLILTALLAACANDKPSGTDTTKPDDLSTTATGQDAVTTAAPEKDSIPEELDYAGRNVGVLYWQDSQFDEFYIEEETGSILGDAIYTRNRNVETRLGVKLSWIGQDGNVSNTESFVKYVSTTSGASAENPYSIIATYSRTAGALAANGYVQNMLGTEYLDFEKSWWPEFVISPATINGKLYFATGDISTNMLYNINCIYYNKDLVETDMNKLVLDGDWTVDKMIEMTKGVYNDKDGGGSKDNNDMYGFVHYAASVNMYFFGAGITVIDKTPDGAMKVSDIFKSEKTQNLLEKVNRQFNSTDDWYYMGSGTANGKAMQTIFAEGRSMFISDAVSLPEKKLLEYEALKYGLVPMPKYDKEQLTYRSILGNPVTLYSIPTMVGENDINMVSAVLECMASEAYRNTTPALFDTIFKIRYVNNEKDSAMFDLIRDNAAIELGIVFNTDLDSIPGNALYSRIAANNSAWLTFIVENGTMLEKLVEKINRKFLEDT